MPSVVYVRLEDGIRLFTCNIILPEAKETKNLAFSGYSIMRRNVTNGCPALMARLDPCHLCPG
jgi:hypothetical protein